MIINNFYLSDTKNIERALRITNLAIDELESIVGRFNKNSHRSGLLRGEVVKTIDNEVFIRHHFTKKVLWRKE
jgi:hypothetical protein